MISSLAENLLHARIKRSPHPHALIKSIDISRAQALPGVKAVVTGDDFPKHIGLYLKDKHIFARDRVRFVGEPVAGVAAVTEEIAEKAVDLIDVEYELLEPVFDPEYGASPEAPLIHPDLENYEVPNFIFPQAGTNIANHFKIRKGDTEQRLGTVCGHCRAQVPHPAHPARAHRTACGHCPGRTNRQSDVVGLLTIPLCPAQPDCQDIGHFPERHARHRPLVGGGFGCKAGVTMEAMPVAIATKVQGAIRLNCC